MLTLKPRRPAYRRPHVLRQIRFAARLGYRVIAEPFRFQSPESIAQTAVEEAAKLIPDSDGFRDRGEVLVGSAEFERLRRYVL